MTSLRHCAFGPIRRLLFGIAFALLAHVVLFATPSWPQSAVAAQEFGAARSDIVPDSRVRYGTLPNGLRYSLMPNSLPAGTISIRFSLRAGSLNEDMDERGLFHFIEHMAFNGSRSVPEDEMIKRLARLGLAFGPDANATTGQTFTTYALDLPRADHATVNDCLFLLREIASELSFDPAAVERERGVILAEARRGDTFERRRREQLLTFLTPGAYAVERMPIGQPDIIASATPDMLRSLYKRFYRPERAVLVIVGDFDPEAMEANLSERFSDWQGEGEPGRDPEDSYSLPTRKKPAASVFVHPDGGDAVSVYSLSPFHKFPDTVAGQRERMLLALGIGAVNRRLAAAANIENPPYRSAQVFASDVLESASYSGGAVSVVPGAWKHGLEALEQAWRGALVYGFTKAEIDQQTAALRTAFVNAAEQEATRKTPALAGSLLSAIQDEEVFAAPSFSLALFEVWTPDATPQAVHDAFRKWMKRDTPLFFMSSTVDQPAVEKEIIAVWTRSEGLAVSRPEERPVARFSYKSFGAAGKVSSDRRVADLQARAVVFDNNVRLNLKKTSFQKGVVLVSLRVGEGAIALETAPFGLASLMKAYSAGGLEKHSFDELQTMLGNRSVQAGFSIFPDFFGGIYMTTPSDLELQLQLAAAYLLNPGYRAEAEREWREAMVLSWPRLDADAKSTFASQGTRLLLAGDRRFGTAPDDGLANRSFTELKAYLDPLLHQAPIEIAIVGDFDEAAAISSVASTFGALPRRASAPRITVSKHSVTFARQDGPIVLAHRGEATQGLLKFYWPIAIEPEREPQEVRALNILAAIMHLKLREVVREDLGASYAPLAGFSSSAVYPGLNYIYAEVEARPADHVKLRAAVRRIADELRQGAITKDELERARTPALDQLAQHASSNGYWLSVIAQLQTRPDRSERLRLDTVDAGVRAVTLEDLQAAAEIWLAETNLREIEILPASTRDEPPP
jgi:zinc protease